MQGVGVDLADRDTYGHLDEASVRRAAGRWLRPQERAWCAAQPSFREAFIIVLSCKEAMYKARSGSGEVHDISLSIQGDGTAGCAVWNTPEGVPVMASWQAVDMSILALAVAAPAAAARDLLERIRATLPSAF